MKKIWLFILLIIPFTNVYAIGTYYSDYRDYKLGTADEYELDDTLKREEYTVYNTAVTNIEDQGYVDETVCDRKYPNDTKTEYTILPTTHNNYIWYTSINIPDGNITHVLLYNAKYVYVSEVYIYDGDTELNVSLQYSDNELDKIVDNDTATYYRLVPNQNIDFVIPKMQAKNFKMHFISNNKVSGSLFFTYEDGTVVNRTILADEVDVVSQERLNEIEPIAGVFTGNGQVASYEKEAHTLYHCYKKESYITNEYKVEPSSENERLILDDNKTIYNYYIRDKVKISDKKITSDKTTLKELVTYSTINLDNLRIEGDVDYTKNGTYPVKFIFNDNFIVEKEVVINIAKNDKVVEPITTKATTTAVTTTSKSTTSSTTKKNTTSTSKSSTTTTTTVPKTTTSKLTTGKTTTKVKTTTKTVKPNDTCPTYNTYDEEEVLEVEPLKGEIEEDKQDKNEKKIIIIKVLLIILVILLFILYIIFRIRENKKESC